MAKKMWGGRFTKKTSPLVEEFTKSIQYDKKLALFDLLGSLAHVEVLGKSKLISHPEKTKLANGLKSLLKKVEKNKLKFSDKCEDIHTFIQNELQKDIGDLSQKLHTARSRNDQVVLATKLYSKSSLCIALNEIDGLIFSLKTLTAKYSQVIIPGFTHMQLAQPVYLKDYLGAYVEMLKRDKDRLNSISKNLNISLGAGALAGTPIDSSKYNTIIKSLKGVRVNPSTNSLDSVSDRDFVIEIINALAIVAMHLSRISEDLIIYSTREFGFIEIDESYCTGSSLMPQKKNPDVLELIRGYSGRVYGNLISVLATMKGLPLTYNRDMQLDKEPLFNSFEIVSSELKVLTKLLKSVKFNTSKIKECLKDESLYATDLVYYLVKKGEPFKAAHTIVGRLVKYSLDNKTEVKDMPEDLIKKFSNKFIKREMVKLFNPIVSVRSKRSIKR